MKENRMRAAVLRAFHEPLCVEERPIPTPGPDEALVKVMASGLCLTDVHIQQGVIRSVRLPYTPGHEMAGIVWALGENARKTGLSVGQHVICAIDITCGTCSLCRAGRENLCLNRVRIGFERDGSHAQYAVVPCANLHPIADKIPFDQACIIPDAVACMYHAIKTQAQAKPGDRMLFYGVGALGLQGVQIARYFGAEVIAAARTQAKLEQARAFGADHIVNTREEELTQAVARLTGGELCDVAFDLVGAEDSLDVMLRCVRPGGKVIALAYGSESFRVRSQELVIKEKEILGLRGAMTRELRETIALVEAGKIIPFVTAHFTLERINDALELLRSSKGLGRSVLMLHPDEAAADQPPEHP